MASTRPVPTSYYYSGQGRLGIGDRNPTTGELKNVLFVGNVTSLTIDLATTKFEHKESMSGLRSIDLTIVQELKPTFKFTAESLILSLLATGLYGTATAALAGGSVTNETHIAKPGYAIPLKHGHISAVPTINVAVGGTALVEGVDFTWDGGFGTVYILATSAVITTETAVEIDYAYGIQDYIEAFTTGTPPEKYLRFEGLNTIDGSLRLIEIPRAAMEPLTGLEYINENVGNGQFAGNILQDTTITTAGKSQYFREVRTA